MADVYVFRIGHNDYFLHAECMEKHLAAVPGQVRTIYTPVSEAKALTIPTIIWPIVCLYCLRPIAEKMEGE